jgi:AAA domain
MRASLSAYSNKIFYGNTLVQAPSFSLDLASIEASWRNSAMLADTASWQYELAQNICHDGLGFIDYKSGLTPNLSYMSTCKAVTYNKLEALATLKVLEVLVVHLNIPPSDIVILCLYRGQVLYIRWLLEIIMRKETSFGPFNADYLPQSICKVSVETLDR